MLFCEKSRNWALVLMEDPAKEAHVIEYASNHNIGGLLKSAIA